MAYDYYNAYLNTTSSTPSIEYRNQLQALINVEFENASDYYIVQKKDRITGVISNIGVRLTKPYELQNKSNLKDDFYQVIFKNTDVSVYLGDIFILNNYHYMVVDVGKTFSPTNSCEIQRCNVQLKFLNSNASVMPVLSATPIVIDGIASKFEVENPKNSSLFRLPDNEILVRIPNDEYSRLIKFGDNGGTRFLFGNPVYAWNCFAIDGISDVRPTFENMPNALNGIINLKLKMSQLNTFVDNVDAGVALQHCY